MEILGFLAIATLVVKIVTVIKSAIGPVRDWNIVVTQAVVWVVGIAVLFLVREADAWSALSIPGMGDTIASLDIASVILAGLILGSTASFGFDALVKRGTAEPSLTGH